MQLTGKISLEFEFSLSLLFLDGP